MSTTTAHRDQFADTIKADPNRQTVEANAGLVVYLLRRACGFWLRRKADAMVDNPEHVFTAKTKRWMMVAAVGVPWWMWYTS